MVHRGQIHIRSSISFELLSITIASVFEEEGRMSPYWVDRWVDDDRATTLKKFLSLEQENQGRWNSDLLPPLPITHLFHGTL